MFEKSFMNLEGNEGENEKDNTPEDESEEDDEGEKDEAPPADEPVEAEAVTDEIKSIIDDPSKTLREASFGAKLEAEGAKYVTKNKKGDKKNPF